MNDPHVCARCAAQGPTCCRLTPGQEEVCFPVSIEEKNRIQDILPHTGGFELQQTTAAFVDNVVRLFPDEREFVKKVFPVGKDHFRLAVDRTGKCRFLGASGCVLPHEVRPYYCRIFPFWYHSGKLIVFDFPGCLAVKEARGTGALLKSLDTNVTRIKDLVARLRLVWGLSPEIGLPKVKKGF